MEVKPVLRIEKGSDKTSPQIVLIVTVPEEYTDQYNEKSTLLFVGALSLGDNKFYPSSYNDDTRLLGAYVGVFQTKTTEYRRWGVSTETLLPRSNVAIAPLNQLLSGEAWKK